MGTFGTISGGRDNRSYRLLLIFQICATTPSELDVKSQLICTCFSPSVRFIIPLFMVGIVRQKPENYYITLLCYTNNVMLDSKFTAYILFLTISKKYEICRLHNQL